MINSNIINVLKTFSAKEMKQFREFVSSPFFNTNENVVELFDIIKKYYPDFNSKSLDKKKIFSKIYRGEKYKDSKMRLLIFYLNDLTEKFFVNKNLNENTTDYKVFLLKELNKRNLSINFEKTINETYKKLNETGIKDSDYLINKFRIDLQHITYFRESPNYKYDTKKSEDNPEEIFMNLTNYYRLMAFEMYGVLLTASFMYKHSFKLDMFEKIIDEFDKTEYSDYPEILCRYYLCMLCSRSEDESNYYELRELLETHRNIVSPAAFGSSFIGLNNFCITSIRAGKRKFLRELFELYKKNLEYKFYMVEGFMTHTFYRNAVSIGTDLEEFDWTRNFIEEYKKELQDEIKEPVYHYSHAFLETELKNYEKALKHLSKVKTDEIYLKVAVRLLQSRLFFELNWQEQLSSLVDASKHFFNNDKILPAAQKEFYAGFFKYILKLSQCRNSGSAGKLESLKSEIEKSDNLHGKDWLLRKANEAAK